MSQKSQDAIDVLSEVIVDTIDKKLGTAKFDKSQTGVVTAVNGNTYTIAVFGSQYNITSDQIFTVGQSVVVTALQGDMKRLVCSPDNVGTMKTVDSKVKVVGDQLSSFIDKDFADTVIRYTDVGKFFNIKDQIYDFYYDLLSGQSKARYGTNFVDTDGVHWYGAGSLCQSRFNYRIILVGQHIAHTTSLMNLCFISCMERLPAWNYICNAINR